MPRLGRTRAVILVVLALLAAFLAWRFVRPLHIFVVSEAFERPVDTRGAGPVFGTLRAAECGACHAEIHQEWQTSYHAKAWTDPYYRVDWAFDGRQTLCDNCHTPLDRQHEGRVVGFRDRDKFDPLLEPNPGFDAALKHEGVNCAGCHLREGKIYGPRGEQAAAPHPVAKFANPNQACVRCHVVQGERWDTFYRMPPCGTVAEIAAGQGRREGRSGEHAVADVAALGCVECHMPKVEPPTEAASGARARRRHTWRGGHDPAMVRSALTVTFAETTGHDGRRRAELTLKNTGANHFVPTGIPDRHLTVQLRALDADGRVLGEVSDKLVRTILWRPFIVDLRDTRLPYGAPRHFTLELPAGTHAVEAQVRYHLLAETRRQRIGYQPEQPISYPVFEQRLPVTTGR